MRGRNSGQGITVRWAGNHMCVVALRWGRAGEDTRVGGNLTHHTVPQVLVGKDYHQSVVTVRWEWGHVVCLVGKITTKSGHGMMK